MKSSINFKIATDALKARAKFQPIERAVLTEGYQVLSEPLNKEEKDFLKRLLEVTMQVCPMEQKQCYHNSQWLIFNWETLFKEDYPNIDVQYAEGFVALPEMPVFPINHGFILINGKLVDPTLIVKGHRSGLKQLPNRIVGEIPDGYVYLAMKLPNKDIVQNMATNYETRTLLDDWENGWPYVKKYMDEIKKEKFKN